VAMSTRALKPRSTGAVSSSPRSPTKRPTCSTSACVDPSPASTPTRARSGTMTSRPTPAVRLATRPTTRTAAKRQPSVRARESVKRQTARSSCTPGVYGGPPPVPTTRAQRPPERPGGRNVSDARPAPQKCGTNGLEMTSASLTAPARRPTVTERTAERLARFVTTGEASPADVGALAEAGLAAVARRRLAGTELADDPRLARAALRARAAHAAVKAQVVPLLAAWREVGADLLLFKGFYLAELVHEDPADRPYSDVDVLLRAPGVEDEELAARLADAAGRVGWRVAWLVNDTSHIDRPGVAYERHELLRVEHPKSGVIVDAHRHLVHGGVAVVGRKKKARITDAVWEASQSVTVGGLEVRAPSYVDSALVGLVTSRSWADDAHSLRPHDYLHLQALMRAGGFGHAELARRARELGAVATLRTFLRACDPTRRALDP